MAGPADKDLRAASEGSVRVFPGARRTVLAARERSMSERLELALSWNKLVAELRGGLAMSTARTGRS